MNIPYVKQLNRNGDVKNPITRANPYLNGYVNRSEARKRNKIKGFAKIVQTVYSEKQWVFKEKYKTLSGETKNRYKRNPNAVPVKTIFHLIIPKVN